MYVCMYVSYVHTYIRTYAGLLAQVDLTPSHPYDNRLIGHDYTHGRLPDLEYMAVI